MVQSTSLGFRHPQGAATVRPAGQVTHVPGQVLKAAGRQMQQVADKYSAHLEEQAALEADLIWTQAQVDWSRKVKEGSRTAGSGYAGTTLKEYDSYVNQAMRTVPLRSVDSMKHKFAKYRIGLEANLIAAEAAAAKRARAAAQAKVRENIGFAAMEGTSIQHFYDVTEGASDADKSYAFKIWSDTVLSEASPEEVEYYRMALEDADMFDEYMTPTQKRTYLKTIASKQVAVSKDAAAEHAKVIEEGANQANLTGDTSVVTDYLEEVVADDSRLRDEERTQLVDTAGKAVDQAELLYSIGDMTPEEINLLVSDAREAATDGDIVPGELDQLTKITNAVTKHKDRIEGDMVKYAHERDPVIRHSWEATKNDPTNMESYLRNLDSRYDVWGIPEDQRVYLPATQASELKDTWNASTNGADPVIAQDFLNVYGDKSKAIINQLRAAGLNEGVIMQLEANDPDVNTWIARSMGLDLSTVKKNYAAKTGEDNAYVNLRDSVFETTYDMREVFFAGRPNTDAFDEKVDVITKAYAQYKIDGGGMDVDEFADKFFAETALNQPLDEGRILALVPKQYDTSDVLGGLDFLMKRVPEKGAVNMTEFIRANAHPRMIDAWTPLDNPDLDIGVMAATLAGSASWITNDTGDGVIIGHLDANNVFTPIPSRTGGYVGISYADLSRLKNLERTPLAEAMRHPPADIEPGTNEYYEWLYGGYGRQ